MKKLFALILALCMLMSLVACTNNNATSNPTNAPTTSVTPTTPTTSQPSDSTTPSTDNNNQNNTTDNPNNITVDALTHTLFNGTDAYMVVNGNKPFFTDEDITTESFETYANLDELGRCGTTFACVGKDLMPTEDRESISSVYPSGWKYNGKSNNHQYDFVDGKYIYNRCHLIGFQLTGENANKQNLITGTRYLNINGMLTFENMIADAVREDDLHVMYRVTPIYVGNNLLPEGVLMEGYSVEDEGETIEFCMFAFNVQPGVEINYATGENWAATEAPPITEPDTDKSEQTYILNTNSKKFHKEDCSAVEKISENHKKPTSCDREELLDAGYTPCGICKP